MKQARSVSTASGDRCPPACRAPAAVLTAFIIFPPYNPPLTPAFSPLVLAAIRHMFRQTSAACDHAGAWARG